MHFKESWKASYVNHCIIVSDWAFFVEFILALLAGSTSTDKQHNINTIYKNYKAINANQQVFCFPVSVNTKHKTREANSLWHELYAVYLFRLLQELDTLPIFFYYELLLLPKAVYL